jgi:hypothetical protein
MVETMALLQATGDAQEGLKLLGVGVAAGAAVIGPGQGWATS